MVGSRSAASRQIEDGRSGLLFTLGPGGLRRGGHRLVRDDQLAAEIGHGARMRVRSRFLAPHFLAAHLELAALIAREPGDP